MIEGGVYVHIPFCRKACSYCDFYFSVRLSWITEFVAALLQEISMRQGEIRPITLYFGGGTPSLLPLGAWEKLLRPWEPYRPYLREITIEVNPEDLTPSHLRFWQDWGINRLSVGVQSFENDILKLLGRSHSGHRARQVIDQIRSAGWENLNVDLIFAIPGLDMKRFLENLSWLTERQIPHVSLYGLTLEPRTVLYKKWQLGRFSPVEDDVYVAHYKAAYAYLCGQGYRGYEVSNWAKPGFESQHNYAYWKGIPYIGFGPGAHSYLPPLRQWNLPKLKDYIENLKQGRLPPAEKEWLTPQQQQQEYWLTRLRLDEAIEILPGYESLIHKWQSRQWVKRVSPKHLRVTLEGRLWIDTMVREISTYGDHTVFTG